MSKRLHVIAPILLVFASNISIADEDSRQLVELPDMMQQHMMSNMRDHMEQVILPSSCQKACNRLAQPCIGQQAALH